MQTFLPYPDFKESAKVLDYKRLGKQRVECLQLIRTILTGRITNGKITPWYNHPACSMWRGYEKSLVIYGIVMCKEWIKRGYKDTCLPKFEYYWQTLLDTSDPRWLGDAAFHASHRSNLLRKDPIWYGKFGWTEPNNLPYIWPV